MKKIIEKLLTVTFPTVNITDLLEIVEATPNPELATEILCGLYRNPIFALTVQELKGDKRTLTFKSFDKWRDRVTYTFSKEKQINGYFPKGTLKESITLDNFHALKEEWKPDSNQITIYVKTGEFVTEENSCSMSTWLEHAPLV